MLAQTVDRVSELVPPENLLIITNVDQKDIILEDLPQLVSEQVIGEPVGRDTAAAVGLATVLVKAKSPDATYAILPADHVIHDGESYRRVLNTAFEAAEKTGALVTIGITPTEPATGYGYIQAGEVECDVNGSPVYRVKRFVEKPNLETAKSYLESGEYYWNAGMFIWKASAIDSALKCFTPALYDGLEKIEQGLAAGNPIEPLMDGVYPTLEKISVDFAIMERAENVVVVESAFDWDDVGAWPAIERHYPKDEAGNVCKGTGAFENANNNIVVSEDGHLTAVIGVEDLIVVHTKDATLVCSKDRAQQIKELVKRLGEDNELKRLV